MALFQGLSTFPITPIHGDGVDDKAFNTILEKSLDAQVDSLGILGSTGGYAYLCVEERFHILQHAVKMAGDTPVFTSIGATNLRDILHCADNAQKAGARALLLPAVSYFPLREEEVFALYETVNRCVSAPIIIYDTPGTTQFTFSVDLLLKLCSLSNVKAIKFPSAYPTPQAALQRFKKLYHSLPKDIALGVSGDPDAACLLQEGATCWYCEWGGIFPQLARQLTDSIINKDEKLQQKTQACFKPFWEMSNKYGGSLRVIASVTQIMGLTQTVALPKPLLGVNEADKTELRRIISVIHPH